MIADDVREAASSDAGGDMTRIQISDPELLSELCDYLSSEGLLAVSASMDEANVLVRGAGNDLDAELAVMAKVAVWKAKQPTVSVTITR